MRCFFGCCKGQIVIHTTDGAEIEDIVENVRKDLHVWPYSLLLCGPTSCRKTTWIVELLKSHEELCTHMPKKLIWIFGVEQPDLFKTIEEIWAPRQSEFVEGFPEDLTPRLVKTSDRGSLCIFDDVME